MMQSRMFLLLIAIVDLDTYKVSRQVNIAALCVSVAHTHRTFPRKILGCIVAYGAGAIRNSQLSRLG